MKSRLQRIEIRNFKAFREFTLDLEGRHLLIYGPNGSGKSSLYWALYTFLQSARKPTDAVAKYFDPAGPERLLNIHEQNAPTPRPGRIAVTLRDFATKTDTQYEITKDTHGTLRQPVIEKGNLASDFVTYRFFFGFSDFKNSADFNIWPLFKREILPFCVATGGRAGDLEDRWNVLQTTPPNPNRYKGPAGAKAFREFGDKLNDYSEALKPVVESISNAAQEFYDTHFAANGEDKISLKLGVTASAYHSKTYKVTMPPVLKFGIQVNGTEVRKPQSFLNEAKMTQLAISIRFAASLVNLHDSDLKLLVLDDLLVSLDMSNRMKVVEILLSETFAPYQKIILTHELGFFREFRRKVGAGHTDWCFFRLEGTPNANIVCKSEKTETQKAEEYLRGYNLDEAALYLRKAAEDMGRRWREWLEKRQLPPGKFFTLTENLRAAKAHLVSELPLKILVKIVEQIPTVHRNLLVASSDEDIDNHAELDPTTKGIIKSKRNSLRQAFSTEHSERLRKIKLIDDILACTERVLNPAAHAGSPPLYEKEVQDALDLIKQLESALTQ